MRPVRLPRSAFQTRKPPRAGRPAWKCADDFRKWLRKLPCVACGVLYTSTNPIVAAHVDHAGGKGTSTKVADRHCIPLCDRCHQAQHRDGWPAFEKTLHCGDAVALADAFWDRWPDRGQWERDLAAKPDAMRGAR